MNQTDQLLATSDCQLTRHTFLISSIPNMVFARLACLQIAGGWVMLLGPTATRGIQSGWHQLYRDDVAALLWKG